MTGLSLVGFLEETLALSHLRDACRCADESTAALQVEWLAAKQRLGPAPMERAGKPDIRPLGPEASEHVARLKEEKWVQRALDTTLKGGEFVLAEIDQLLAYQFTIDTDRVAHHNRHQQTKPTERELLHMCLPTERRAENITISKHDRYTTNGAMMITSRGLNFVNLAQGLHDTDLGLFVGLEVGVLLPLVQVVRHQGRYYLHNGFHRAVGARARGETHVPCVLRDVDYHASIGIQDPGFTFQAELLESANPPTVGHFTHDRAHPVHLKHFSRTLHVTWAEYVLACD